MQTYDLLMIAVLACATLFGFVKGMAWQVAYLASLIVSYIAAVKFSPQLAPTFGDAAPFNRFAAMLAIYIATSFVIWIIFRGVAGAIDRVKLNEFDRQMGALIGLREVSCGVSASPSLPRHCWSLTALRSLTHGRATTSVCSWPRANRWCHPKCKK